MGSNREAKKRAYTKARRKAEATAAKLVKFKLFTDSVSSATILANASLDDNEVIKEHLEVENALIDALDEYKSLKAEAESEGDTEHIKQCDAMISAIEKQYDQVENRFQFLMVYVQHQAMKRQQEEAKINHHSEDTNVGETKPDTSKFECDKGTNDNNNAGEVQKNASELSQDQINGILDSCLPTTTTTNLERKINKDIDSRLPILEDFDDDEEVKKANEAFDKFDLLNKRATRSMRLASFNPADNEVIKQHFWAEENCLKAIDHLNNIADSTDSPEIKKKCKSQIDELNKRYVTLEAQFQAIMEEMQFNELKRDKARRARSGNHSKQGVNHNDSIKTLSQEEINQIKYSKLNPKHRNQIISDIQQTRQEYDRTHSADSQQETSQPQQANESDRHAQEQQERLNDAEAFAMGAMGMADDAQRQATYAQEQAEQAQAEIRKQSRGNTRQSGRNRNGTSPNPIKMTKSGRGGASTGSSSRGGASTSSGSRGGGSTGSSSLGGGSTGNSSHGGTSGGGRGGTGSGRRGAPLGNKNAAKRGGTKVKDRTAAVMARLQKRMQSLTKQMQTAKQNGNERRAETLEKMIDNVKKQMERLRKMTQKRQPKHMGKPQKDPYAKAKHAKR